MIYSPVQIEQNNDYLYRNFIQVISNQIKKMVAILVMRKPLLIIIFLTWLTPLYAKDLKGEYAVFGPGGKTCKSFILALELDGKYYDEYELWLLGYFSAYNQYTPNTYNILGIRRLDQIISWLEQYCQKNLNEFFVTAAAVLLKNMHDTRRNLSPKKSEKSFLNID